MDPSAVLVGTDARGVATLTLNRPAVHNAFDDRLIADLAAALRRLEADPAVRMVLLTGSGQSFSAGAEIEPPISQDSIDIQDDESHPRSAPRRLRRSRQWTAGRRGH